MISNSSQCNDDAAGVRNLLSKKLESAYCADADSRLLSQIISTRQSLQEQPFNLDALARATLVCSPKSNAESPANWVVRSIAFRSSLKGYGGYDCGWNFGGAG